MSCNSKIPLPRLDTADDASRNLAIVDAGPVVRQEICAPSHIPMGREVLLDRLLAQQTRYPKERRHRLRVPDGLAQRRKTLFDFARRLIHGHFANGVVLGVVGHGVAFVVNAQHHPRIGVRHLSDLIKRGVFRGESMATGRRSRLGTWSTRNGPIPGGQVGELRSDFYVC